MSSELTPVPEGTAIFSADPRKVLRESELVAQSLGRVLLDRQLVISIGNRQHVLIEGWTLLGSMVGVFAEIEWTRPMQVDTETAPYGWEARAIARTIDGRQISAAEASCGRDEYAWKRRDDYALRSMAQTRAISKALRLPLGFIVELAGYSATPADEIPAASVIGEPAPADQRQRITPGAEARGLKRAIEETAEARGITPDQVRAIADEVGVSGGRANPTQLRQILDRVRALDTDADLPEIDQGESDDEGTGSAS